jgi:transposase
VERYLQHLQIKTRQELAVNALSENNNRKRLTLVEARRQWCRLARLERYKAVVELADKDCKQLEIAAQVGIDPGTVARWLKAGSFPERRIRSDRRRKQIPREDDIQHYSRARMAALLSMPSSKLSVEQAKTLATFLKFYPRARIISSFVGRFRAMLRWRTARCLNSWIEDAMNSGFTALAQFARTLRRDLKAVQLAITTKWSNGPVEGHIHRLKLIKRQMYGRASFQLLKARVLPWSYP